MAALERRLLQVVVAVACLIPIGMGGLGMLRGAGILRDAASSPDLDSHFRYLSGIFFAVGIFFASCIPHIETKGPRFRLLGTLVVTGGLARLLSFVVFGPPSLGHQLGLVMELVVVPLLMLWQARVASHPPQK